MMELLFYLLENLMVHWIFSLKVQMLELKEMKKKTNERIQNIDK